MPPKNPYRLFDGLGFTQPVDYAYLTGIKKLGAVLTPTSDTYVFVSGGSGDGVGPVGPPGADGAAGPPGVDGSNSYVTADFITQLLLAQPLPQAAVRVTFPLWWFGDGSDGSLTLVADTVLTLGENIKKYTNVSLAGYTLTHHATDVGMVVHVWDTLSMGGGSIRSLIGTATAGADSAQAGGDGGDGGGQSGAIYVFANHIVGSGTIGGGWDGTNGENGAVSTGLANGSAGTQDAVLTYFMGWNLATVATSCGKSASAPGYQFVPSTAGAAGTGHAATTDVTRTCRDYLRFLTPPSGHIYGEGVEANDPFHWTSSAGSGAACGTDDNADGVNRSSDSGGGSGGGAGLGNGGAGGRGGEGFTGLNPGAGGAGGGGGSGGGGGLTVVVCSSQTGALVVSANGGNGGNGGDTYLPATFTWSPGGGGGGGGGGGVAVFCGPADSSATVTAVGGTAGTKGSNDGNNGVECADGVAGVDGISHFVKYQV